MALSSAAWWQCGVRSFARCCGSRSPATMAVRMAMPVAPVMSLTTWVRVRGSCGKAWGLGGLGGAAEGRRLWRWRKEPRSPHTWASGRKAPARSP